MNIRSVLFDIDGTLIARGEPLLGAIAAVDWVRAQGLGLRLLTNITSRGPSEIAQELRRNGFRVADNEVQTATGACVEYLRARGSIRCHLIVPPKVKSLFRGIAEDDHRPDVVVIGDIGEDFNYRILNEAFSQLRAGAELVVPQKGMFWIDNDGPKLDCGAFIVGLEAATGKQALITGKPSPHFFFAALRHLDCDAAQALVIGDDVATDVRGARAVGASSALVGTGKYRPGDECLRTDAADHFLPTLQELPQLLKRL
jgi:HAD superfamily hydrolase (TIGR01458 family)